MSHVQISLENLAPGKPMKVSLEGNDVCVARIGDEIFAVADTCTHSEASLSEGEINGQKIECRSEGTRLNSSHEWISRMPSSA